MASNRGHRLRLEDISHRFGDVLAVRDINLDIAGGELMALLGPCSNDSARRGYLVHCRGRSTSISAPQWSRRSLGLVMNVW